ncbi:general transcription factor IIF subunit 2-like [Penaeus japonicus]|uniref:general transcription factor IIF subunit 2-like n=1 Tax=Penaeus japonicus TaxID=27405 RepID=UPI001C714D50|nr:general transcription factor IIF subunit 2-like [Penaeus japonicus]
MSSSHAEKDLDNTNCGRGVWLVKIPKYMKDKWVECPGDVGKLRINKVPGKVPTVTFKSSENMMDSKTPREHKFILHSVKEQTLGVFSHTVSSGNSDAVVPETEKLFMEGQVIQKFECQPVVDTYYLNQKREAVKKAAQPCRQSMFIQRPVSVYRPIAAHKHTMETEERKKAEGKKARDDKDKVMEMLFAAFEKHQYYNIKDLQKITRQPITYLKEILNEVCDYNVKNPHRNMWELKPEYRHYKADEVEAADDPNSD